MEDVKKVLETINTMQADGADNAAVGSYVKSTGYDVQALSQAFKTYKETGEVDIAGAGTSMLQGLTFGFSEEIGGIGAALTGGSYDEYVTQQRNKMKLYQQENPVISAAFEVVGSLPTMLIPGAGVAKGVTGATKMATAMRAAATAGAQGALYGFGTGEGLEGSVENALLSGGVSAGVGALVSPLARAGASIKASSGMPTQQAATETLAKRMGTETMDAFTAPQFQQQAGMSLADTGDEAARYLRGIRGLDSKASQLIDETLDARWKDQYKRVTTLINEAFDSDPQLVKALSGDLADMKDAAGLAYTKLYTDFVDIKAPSLGSMIRNEKVLSDHWDEALGYAIKESSKDPVKQAALKSLPKAADIADDTPMPMQILDTMKKYLDVDVRKAMASQESTAASRERAFNAIKNDFVDSLDSLTDNAYAKVRNNFAEPAKMEEALELGRSAFAKKTSADQIKYQLSQYNPQEAKAYVAGVLQNIYGTINNTGYSRDTLVNLVGTPEMTAKLKALMPNEAAWTVFKKTIANEAKQVRTKQLVKGGSNTADKLQDISQADTLLDDAVSLMFDPTLASVNSNVLSRARTFAANLAKRTFTNAESRSLQAKMLLETDPAKRKAIAEQIATARRELAKRAEQSTQKGAAVGTVAGDVTSVGLFGEPEDKPLYIIVTK
jgi:hypothetical protein